MPKRIQRRRTRGWRMPENTVYVGRPSKWGNPFRVGGSVDAAAAVANFERSITPARRSEIVAALRGRNLACWCRLGEPCHADVLMRIANDDNDA